MRVGKRERAAIMLREAEASAVEARKARIVGQKIRTSLSSMWPHDHDRNGVSKVHCVAPSSRALWTPRGTFSRGRSVSV